MQSNNGANFGLSDLHAVRRKSRSCSAVQQTSNQQLSTHSGSNPCLSAQARTSGGQYGGDLRSGKESVQAIFGASKPNHVHWGRSGPGYSRIQHDE